LVIPNL